MGEASGPKIMTFVCVCLCLICYYAEICVCVIFLQELTGWPGAQWDTEKQQIVPQLKFNINAVNSSLSQEVGTWTTQKRLTLNPDYQQSPIRRYFKIGTVKVSRYNVFLILHTENTASFPLLCPCLFWRAIRTSHILFVSPHRNLEPMTDIIFICCIESEFCPSTCVLILGRGLWSFN